MFSSATKLITLLTCVLNVAYGFPNGPPVAAHSTICDSMAPQHSAAPMTTAAPYMFKVSSTCYNEDTTLAARITISDSNDEAAFFEGFFAMARKTDTTTMSYGTFDARDVEYIQELRCHDQDNSAIGHNAALHYLARTFYWTAPSSDQGNIRLVATVVREEDEIWMNVMSDVIMYDADCIANMTLTDESYPDIDMDEDPCGSDVNASDQPAGCGCDSIGPIKSLLAIAAMTVALLSFKRA